MKRKPLIIGELKLEYPFVLAPLAGITDRSMRSLCATAGASLTYTEMVSAKGLWYGDSKTGELLRTDGGETPLRPSNRDAGGDSAAQRTLNDTARIEPVGFQLFGCEPEILAYAVRLLSDPAHAKAVDAEMAMRYGAATRPPMGARTVLEHGLTPPVLFDLNAGCPVPKIVRNGEGSALLKNPERLYECIAAMVRASEAAARMKEAAQRKETAQRNEAYEKYARRTISPIPVTVKIRKGFERDNDCAVDIAKAAEAAGAAAITVHGRTRQQYYEGRADWEVIARVKDAVNIPVIGNGDVHSGADAIRMLEETGCDGVMIARGALGNPWIFQDACRLWDSCAGVEDPDSAAGVAGPASVSGVVDPDSAAGVAGPASVSGVVDTDPAPVVSEEQRIGLLLQHIDMVCEDKGEHVAVREMRKHVGWYIKGMRGAARIRQRVNTAENVNEMKQILSGMLDAPQ